MARSSAVGAILGNELELTETALPPSGGKGCLCLSGAVCRVQLSELDNGGQMPILTLAVAVWIPVCISCLLWYEWHR